MLPVSAAIAAFFGVLFGAPTLRLKGDYLAIVTLGFGEIVPIVVRNTPTVTNGAMGLNGVAAPQLFGCSFGVNATPYYYVGVALVAFLIVTSLRLKDSRIGRAWMAIREDEIAAAAMGVNRVRLSSSPSPPAPPSPARPARSSSPNCRPRPPTCSCFRSRS